MRQWYERWKTDGVFCLVYRTRTARRMGWWAGCGRGRSPSAEWVPPAAGLGGELLQENGRRAKSDLDRSLQSRASRPQVRPARLTKKAIMRATSTM